MSEQFVLGLFPDCATQLAFTASVAEPDDPITRGRILANRAAVRALAGDRDGAIADLRAATEAAPEMVPAWLNLAELQRREGLLEDARRSNRTTVCKSLRWTMPIRPAFVLAIPAPSSKNPVRTKDILPRWPANTTSSPKENPLSLAKA